MKFLPLRDFDVVTSAINFSTPECRVTGGCDLYTTKAAGPDKKLYKRIDSSLESQHDALLKLGASLSPPVREQMAASLNLSRSSPFGPLSDISSRRTFAYLIATLNASHPDYDFSHVLRPTDFRRERNLRRVMSAIDNTLLSVRPHGTSLVSSSLGSSYRAYSVSPATSMMSSDVGSPTWGPMMWTMIDKEMALKDCTIFAYQPADDPFDGDEAAIWRMHYFFFNKALKRVCYLYVRGVPVVVSSPALGPAFRPRRASNTPHGTTLKRPSISSDGGASKRARFWLGEQFAGRIVASDEDDQDPEDEFELGDAVFWDPDDDVDIDPLNDPSEKSSSEDEYDASESEEEDEDEQDLDCIAKSPVRGASEDIMGRMTP